jgi:hypothetical protein
VQASRPFLARWVAPAALAVLAACQSAPPEPSACLVALTSHGAPVTTAEVDPPRSACTIDDPVRAAGAAIQWNQPAVASCRLVSTMDEFERDVVQPAALRYFREKVVRIDHLGAWSCRRRAGWFFPRWSEHAKGKAIDVSGFELAGGRRVTVAGDWSRRGPARDFLRAVAKGACSYFAVVLTPNTDRDHRDHFHLDVGPQKACSV